MTGFHDRRDAGRQLAATLMRYAGRADVQMLALPRGGIPVAVEIARALNVPLDVIVVRKLGVPGHEELAMGAIASGGMPQLDSRTIRAFGVAPLLVQRVISAERRELARRETLYRGHVPFPDVHGQVVIVVDDGLATGATMRAAVRALRSRRPATIVAAVPVASRDACDEVRLVADDCVCLMTPEPFVAVGWWYANFSRTRDDDVQSLLGSARHMSRGAAEAR